MTADLERLFLALRERPVDRKLDQLEPRVWGRIEAARTIVWPTRSWRWQAGLAAVMLAFGAFAGGAAAARPESDFSPFAVHAAYAPSTLLGDDR
ncbi:MAG: hypothetical protein J0L81_11945 [Caulobacterales bacterium]|jgi:hypothetical protein|nr:hypothetical protein [Caulobacterales bacterium]